MKNLFGTAIVSRVVSELTPTSKLIMDKEIGKAVVVFLSVSRGYDINSIY
jgi:hypothetical protein